MPHGVRGEQSTIRLKSRLNENLLGPDADAILVSSPQGYSPLGLLMSELRGLNDDLAAELAEKCDLFNESMDFIICGFNLTKDIRVILVPNQNSNFYLSNSPVQNDIWLDFLYASTYYSFVLASHMGVKRLALTHSLHGIDQRFIYCVGDALGLYADSFVSNTLQEIVFKGCCFTEDNLGSLIHLNHEGAFTTHRELPYEITQFHGMDCLRLTF